MTLGRLSPALLVIGVALMVPFEDVITRVLGVLCLLGFVVTGLFAIATPEFLDRKDGESAPEAPPTRQA